MKNTKKILPALAMLIVSAVMLSTASFAWFATQSTVQANGMSVNIKSDSKYMLIAYGAVTDAQNTADIMQGNPQISANYDDSIAAVNSILAPAAHNVTHTAGVLESATAFDGFATVATNTLSGAGWYTAKSGNAEQSTPDGQVTYSALTSLDGYVAKYSYAVVMMDGSQKGYNLSVVELEGGGINVSDDTGTNPISIVLVSGTQYMEYRNDTAAASDTAHKWTKVAGTAEFLIEELDSETSQQIDIYIYYNGNHQDVNTNNAPNLKGVTINLTFQVEDSAS